MPMNIEIKRESFEVIKRVKGKVAHVRWTINNFAKACSLIVGDALNSDKFALGNGELSNTCSLKLCRSDSSDGSFSLGIDQYFEGKDPVDIDCDAWIEDLGGNKYFEVELEDSNQVDDVVYHYFTNSFQEEDLGTTIKLKNDVAIICVEVKQYVGHEEVPKFVLELPQKLWNSYQQGLVDSITIQVESNELKVSKAILAANSDVFQQMLLTINCKEVQENTIVIKEASYDAMKAFIEYMHRGEVNNLSEICDDLFVLAHKYLVVPLQEDCAKEMVKSLNKENLFSRLKCAFLYNEENLKDSVLEYVTSKNSDMNFRQILKSTQWISFSSENFALAQEIIDAVYDKMQLFPEQSNDQASVEN